MRKLHQRQTFKASKADLWEFICKPENLSKITPDTMSFDIVKIGNEGKLSEDMEIEYRVSPFAGIKMKWVSVISDIVEGERFTDSQKQGPYTSWRHEHMLIENPDGTVTMEDHISYEVPGGFFRGLIDKMVVRPRLDAIFAFRRQAMAGFFEEVG